MNQKTPIEIIYPTVGFCDPYQPASQAGVDITKTQPFGGKRRSYVYVRQMRDRFALFFQDEKGELAYPPFFRYCRSLRRDLLSVEDAEELIRKCQAANTERSSQRTSVSGMMKMVTRCPDAWVNGAIPNDTIRKSVAPLGEIGEMLPEARNSNLVRARSLLTAMGYKHQGHLWRPTATTYNIWFALMSIYAHLDWDSCPATEAWIVDEKLHTKFVEAYGTSAGEMVRTRQMDPREVYTEHWVVCQEYDDHVPIAKLYPKHNQMVLRFPPPEYEKHVEVPEVVLPEIEAPKMVEGGQLDVPVGDKSATLLRAWAGGGRGWKEIPPPQAFLEGVWYAAPPMLTAAAEMPLPGRLGIPFWDTAKWYPSGYIRALEEELEAKTAAAIEDIKVSMRIQGLQVFLYGDIYLHGNGEKVKKVVGAEH